MKRLKLNRWLISIVALAMLVLVFNSDERQIEDEIQADMPDSDYYMQNVTVFQYDSSGLISNTLTADKMQHYIENDLSLLETPIITYKKSDDGSWKLHSKSGVIRDNTLLELENIVTIEELSSDQLSQSRIITKDLSINLVKNTAFTSQPVLIESIHQKTRSTGLEFDLANEIIKLTSNVRSEIYQQ